MLIKLTVKNFRSYKDENTLLLTSTTKIQVHPEHEREIGRLKVLKFAGIYGDNASGKTNILKALNFLKMFVCFGVVSDSDYAFKDNESEPTTIDLVFHSGGFIYQYILSFIQKSLPFPSISIVDESLGLVGTKEVRGKTLYSLKNGLNQNVLAPSERPVYDIFLSGYRQMSKLMRSKPFLSYINEPDKMVSGSEMSKHLARAFSFLKDDLVILGAESTNMVPVFENNLDKVAKYTKEFDPSIEEIRLCRIPNEEVTKLVPEPVVKDIISQLGLLKAKTITLTMGNNYFFFSKDADTFFKCETLQIKHHYIKTWFNFFEESEGTKKFLILMSYFSTKNVKKTYCLDELERSMHPSSSDYLLKFFDEETKGQETQFIFTTHNPSFMKTALRRDEIYFAEKDMYGSSAIYPLTDFSTRTDSDLPSLFLEGQFRKIPERGRRIFDDDAVNK